tara:strand:+ start:1273 stop:1779 length:507 start_codon:yes stop_codon:yes gene_type:complete
MADRKEFRGSVEFKGALKTPSISATDARTLTADENGATIFWTKDSGHHLTLPPAAEGLYYRIVVLVGSSNNHHIVAASGDTFYGKVTVVGSGADNDVAVQTVTKAASQANPTAIGNHDHMKIDQNAADTGGEAGSVINLWAVDDSGWLVDAHLSTSGTPASIATIYSG